MNERASERASGMARLLKGAFGVLGISYELMNGVGW